MEADHKLNYIQRTITDEIYNKMIYDIRIKNLFHIERGYRIINLFIINSQNIILKNYKISVRVESYDLYEITVFDYDKIFENMIYTKNSYEDIICTLLMIAEII